MGIKEYLSNSSKQSMTRLVFLFGSIICYSVFIFVVLIWGLSYIEYSKTMSELTKEYLKYTKDFNLDKINNYSVIINNIKDNYKPLDLGGVTALISLMFGIVFTGKVAQKPFEKNTEE